MSDTPANPVPCSGRIAVSGGYICKFGHNGPGMQACSGIRYPDGKALAPCEREDLPFDEESLCVSVAMKDD